MKDRESVCLDQDGNEVSDPLVWFNRFRCATAGCPADKLVEIAPQITADSIRAERLLP